MLLLLVPEVKLVGRTQRQAPPLILFLCLGAVRLVGNGFGHRYRHRHRQARDDGLDGGQGGQGGAKGFFSFGKPVLEAVDVGCGDATLSALCIATGEGGCLAWRTAWPVWGSAGQQRVARRGGVGGQDAVAFALFGAAELTCYGVEGVGRIGRIGGTGWTGGIQGIEGIKGLVADSASARERHKARGGHCLYHGGTWKGRGDGGVARINGCVQLPRQAR